MGIIFKKERKNLKNVPFIVYCGTFSTLGDIFCQIFVKAKFGNRKLFPSLQWKLTVIDVNSIVPLEMMVKYTCIMIKHKTNHQINNFNLYQMVEKKIPSTGTPSTATIMISIVTHCQDPPPPNYHPRSMYIVLTWSEHQYQMEEMVSPNMMPGQGRDPSS